MKNLLVFLITLQLILYVKAECQSYRYRLGENQTIDFVCISETAKSGQCSKQFCEFSNPNSLYPTFIGCTTDAGCPNGFRCCYDYCWRTKICRPIEKYPEFTTASTMETSINTTEGEDDGVTTEISLTATPTELHASTNGVSDTITESTMLTTLSTTVDGVTTTDDGTLPPETGHGSSTNTQAKDADVTSAYVIESTSDAFLYSGSGSGTLNEHDIDDTDDSDDTESYAERDSTYFDE